MNERKFYEINGEAKEEIRKKSVDVANKLENTFYEIKLNHKQLVMIFQWLEAFKENLTITAEQDELLKILNNSKEVKQ